MAPAGKTKGKDVEEKHTYDNQSLDDGGVKAKTLNWGGVGWKAPKAQKGPEVQLELIYGEGRGLMELARLMLAFKGKFPGKDYEDGRYGADKSKIENRLSANLGRMPCLWVKSSSGTSMSSQAIGSTTSIYYYIAYHCNLLGSNPIETAQIFGIHEAIKDLKKAQMAFMGKETDEASLDAWFEIGHTNAGATDRSPANADPEQRNNRRCRWFMERLEHIIGGGGYAVGNAPSMADIALFYHFRESVTEAQGPQMTKYQREPMSSKARVDDALLRCPKIKKICDNVEGNANIQKWLQTRGVQKF